MTGPEHYQKAEKLLDSLDTRIYTAAEVTHVLDQAKVHATLASVAAIVAAAYDNVAHQYSWGEAIGIDN